MLVNERIASLLLVTGLLGIMTSVVPYMIAGIIMFGFGFGWLVFYLPKSQTEQEDKCCK